VSTFEEKWQEIEAQWKTREQEQKQEHKGNVDRINNEYDKAEQLHNTRMENYQRESQHGGVELESKILTALEQDRREKLAAENERYQREQAAVEKQRSEFAVDPRVEQIVSERNTLKELQAEQRTAHEEFRRESEARPDVTPEERLGQWVKAYGPPVEKAWNAGADLWNSNPHTQHLGEIPKFPENMDWEAAGNAVEVAGGKIRANAPESLQPYLLTSKQVDELILSGFAQDQKRDREHQDVKHSLLLEGLAQQLDKNINKEIERDR
jgi:hypothetical protein